MAADVVLALAQELASHVTPLLVEGETLDVQFAGMRKQISEADVVDMLWKKTGVLYEFAGRAGAAIALNNAQTSDACRRRWHWPGFAACAERHFRFKTIFWAWSAMQNSWANRSVPIFARASLRS